MKISMRVIGAFRKLAQLRAAVPRARTRAMVNLGKTFSGLAMLNAAGHVDTGRFYNALAMAFAQAGLGVYPMKSPQNSRRKEEIVNTLRDQVGYWWRKRRQYQNEKRTGQKYYRKIERRLRRALENLRKFDKTEGAIVIGAGPFGQSGKRTYVYGLRGKDGMVYGGTGAILHVGNKSVLKIVVKEPHGRIVEHRFRILRNARAGTGMVGGFKLRAVRQTFLANLTATQPAGLRAGGLGLPGR